MSKRIVGIFWRSVQYALLGVFALLLLLIIAENLCRIMFPDWISRWQDRVQLWVYDEELGWKQRPNVSSSVQHPEFSISVNTNAYGLRDKDYSLVKSEKKRMLVLGGSFVWGYGVEADQRFTEVLEKRHTDWEIINAGITGYGTDQTYLYYLREGHQFNADVVLLLLYYVDFQHNYLGEEYSHYKPYFSLDENNKLIRHNNPVPTSSLSQRINRTIETDTFFLVRLKNVVSAMGRPVYRFLSGDNKEVALGFTHVVESMPVTNVLITELADSVKKNNARFVLLAIPSRNIYTNNLNILAGQLKLDYLNLDPAFTGREVELQIPGDDHWNVAGHQYTADILDEYFKKIGIF